MIIRLVHAKVKAGKQAEFRQVLELLALVDARTKNGLLAFYPGQPLGPDSNEFILVSVWKNRKAAEAASEEEWIKKIIPAEAMPLVEEWRVHGYRSLEAFDQPLKPIFQNI